MAQWFYYKNGDVEGPYKSDDIKGMIQAGDLRSDDLIYLNGEEDWTELGSRMEFVEEARANREKVDAMDIISSKDWVVLSRKSQNEKEGFLQLGPFNSNEIKEQLFTGNISYSDFIWKEGYSSWVLIREVEDFVDSERQQSKNGETKFEVQTLSKEELLKDVLKETKINTESEIEPAESVTSNLATQFGVDTVDRDIRNHAWETNKEDVSQNRPRTSESAYFYKIPSLKIPKAIALFAERNPIKKVKKINLETILIGGGFLAALIATSFWWSSRSSDGDTKSTQVKPIEYTVKNQGREILFAAPKLAGRTMDVKLTDQDMEILSANEVKKNIRILLDDNGAATIRLDQLSLSEGRYKFKAIVGLTEVQGKFFYGEKEKGFMGRLRAFRHSRSEETKKAALAIKIVKPKPIPKELKSFYKFSRDLEDGHKRLKTNPIGWKGFYQKWGKQYYQFQSDTLKKVKEELHERPELTKKVDRLSGEIEKLSLDMDLSVRYRGGKGNFEVVSTKVSDVIESVRESN